MTPEPEFAPRYRGADKLKGRIALISGGDSGIGRAVAVAFAREGADIAFIYLEEDKDADDTCGMVEAEGRTVMKLKGDMGDEAFCREAVSRVIDRTRSASARCLTMTPLGRPLEPEVCTT